MRSILTGYVSNVSEAGIARTKIVDMELASPDVERIYPGNELTVVGGGAPLHLQGDLMRIDTVSRNFLVQETAKDWVQQVTGADIDAAREVLMLNHVLLHIREVRTQLHQFQR